MNQRLFYIGLIFLFLMYGSVRADHFVTNDWKINIDAEKENLSLSNKILGNLLTNVQLCIKEINRITVLRGWQYQFSDGRLIIHTSKPVETRWEFHFSENKIDVYTSGQSMQITTIMPAPTNRFPARIADPANMQEQETGENDDYTGVAQIEKYFVPSDNPQVMYVSLGLVESTNLHALFDKASNTVIRFSPETKMKRWLENQSFLKVTIPIKKESNLLSLIPNYYVDVLGMPKYVPYDDTRHKAAPTGWNHWLAFFRQVTESDIVEHADFIS